MWDGAEDLCLALNSSKEIGSSQSLYQFMKDAGFDQIEVNVVAREHEEPQFQTVLASGVKR